jgi:hypothetical protein
LRKGEEKISANLSYASIGSLPNYFIEIVGGRGSDCTIAEITGKRKLKLGAASTYRFLQSPQLVLFEKKCINLVLVLAI